MARATTLERHGSLERQPPEELLAAFRDLIDTLEVLDLHVAHATIDKPKLHERYDGAADKNAYRLAMQFLLEKLDAYGSNRKLIIADKAKEEQIRAQDIVAGMQQWSWGGEVPGRQLTTIIDSLHFVRSAASPGVQLADAVAFIKQRARRGANHPEATAALQEMDAVIGRRTATWLLGLAFLTPGAGSPGWHSPADTHAWSHRFGRPQAGDQ